MHKRQRKTINARIKVEIIFNNTFLAGSEDDVDFEDDDFEDEDRDDCFEDEDEEDAFLLDDDELPAIVFVVYSSTHEMVDQFDNEHSAY